MKTEIEIKRRIAIALYATEWDAPDLITWEHATRGYDDPASTGEHSGDCTNEAHTCLRCVREEADKKAAYIFEKLKEFF